MLRLSHFPVYVTHIGYLFHIADQRLSNKQSDAKLEVGEL